MIPFGYIYGLKEPDTEKIRYIGFTTNPKKRYTNHCYIKKLDSSRKACWIKSLKDKRLSPIMEIIDETTKIDWQEKEKHYIKLFKSFGAKLVNGTIGGEGVFGHKQIHSFKYKEKMSKIIKNKLSENPKLLKDRITQLKLTAKKGSLEAIKKTQKSYRISYPNGKIEFITGLRNFCRINNLNAGWMVQVAKGTQKQHKGFKCELIVVKEDS